MAISVISSLVETLYDEGGKPRTFGYYLVEFGGTYASGGVQIPLSGNFSRVEKIMARVASGQIMLDPAANSQDMPALTPQSARLALYRWTDAGSGVEGFKTEADNAEAISGQRATLFIVGG